MNARTKQILNYIGLCWREVWLWRVATTINVTLLILVLGYESRVPERICSKMHRGKLSAECKSDVLSPQKYDFIVMRTWKDLADFKPILKAQSNCGRTEALLRTCFNSKNAKFHFSHALLLLGLIESIKNKDTKIALSDIEKWCEQIIDRTGKFRSKLRYLDECTIGYVFCELYDLTKNEKYRIGADQVAEFLLNEYPRNQKGTLPYFQEHPNVMLIDDKIICGFLVRYGEQFGIPRATTLGINQMREFMQLGMDRDTGLPWHAYNQSNFATFGELGWLRGMGWLCIGLSETLKFLPKNNSNYKELHDKFLELLKICQSYQIKIQCWNWAINNTLAHEDTSGTAMIGYAIESAIECGVIDSSWAAMSENALSSVLRLTHDNGVVDSALADCNGVGHYANCFGPSNFAQGPTTALYSLYLRRTRHELQPNNYSDLLSSNNFMN